MPWLAFLHHNQQLFDVFSSFFFSLSANRRLFWGLFAVNCEQRPLAAVNSGTFYAWEYTVWAKILLNQFTPTPTKWQTINLNHAEIIAAKLTEVFTWPFNFCMLVYPWVCEVGTVYILLCIQTFMLAKKVNGLHFINIFMIMTGSKRLHLF